MEGRQQASEAVLQELEQPQLPLSLGLSHLSVPIAEGNSRIPAVTAIFLKLGKLCSVSLLTLNGVQTAAPCSLHYWVFRIQLSYAVY